MIKVFRIVWGKYYHIDLKTKEELEKCDRTHIDMPKPIIVDIPDIT